METDYDNRINVSVSVDCIKDIDAIIEGSGLFNKRSDFVFAAVRAFFYECTHRFNRAILESKAKGKTPLEEYVLFTQATLDFGSHQLEEYIEKYGGPNVKQIPIRPDPLFYNMLLALSAHLFKGDESECILKTCRAAICMYASDVRRIIEEYNKFDSEYRKLGSRKKTDKVDINY